MINIGGKLLNISSPIVMSIVNVTPDSFFSDSRATNEKDIVERVGRALDEGATIIDIGGYSSRPNADDVSLEEEYLRVSKAMSLITKEFPSAILSIDTFRADVVKRLYENYGSFIVNDISAGLLDSKMIEVVGELSLPYIAMHMKGNPKDMMKNTHYDDIIKDIIRYFVERINTLQDAGVKDIIIDPGFGFSKTTEQNYQLMNRMSELKIFGKPILGGISRKTMIWKTLDIKPDEALNGTTALNWELLRQGASILRVHDTKEAMQTIKLFKKISE